MGETVCREKGLSKRKLDAPKGPAAPKENGCGGSRAVGTACVYRPWVRGPLVSLERGGEFPELGGHPLLGLTWALVGVFSMGQLL